MDANWRRDAIVELLRQKGKVKARELAKRFHVTRQTICQDITVLSLHCDIYTERGQNGGIYLLEKKRPIRKSLSSSQIQVLEQLLPSLSEEKRLIIQSILDPRAAPGKRYHQVVLEALPDMPIAETIEDIHSFFRIHKGPDYFLPQNDTEDN